MTRLDTKVMFSSQNEVWETPQSFFDELNQEFHFTLDPCAIKENAKCAHYFTEKENGLLQDWSGHTVFCNPPYGRNKTGAWVKKAFEESQKENTIVVCLIPTRTDTKWFHEYIYQKAEVRFVRGRLKFGGGKTFCAFSVNGGSFSAAYGG